MNTIRKHKIHWTTEGTELYRADSDLCNSRTSRGRSFASNVVSSQSIQSSEWWY